MKATALLQRIILAAAIFISGCSLSGEPVPEDHYYRLPPVEVERPLPLIFDDVVMRPVQVSGLYHERAMLYVEQDRPLDIRRYHYHYWARPPASMLARYMRDWFMASGLTQRVRIEALGEDARVTVTPVLVEFERVVTPRGPENRVALEFKVAGAGSSDWSKLYRHQQAAASPSMHDSAAAFGQALDRVMQQFSSDLVQKSR